MLLAENSQGVQILILASKATSTVTVVVVVVVVVFTLKTVLTSIQHLLFLTLRGKETNFRGRKLTKSKVHKNKNKIKKDPEKVPTLATKIRYRFLKITGSEKKKEQVRVGKPQKGSRAHRSLQTRKLSHKQNILDRNTNTGKKINEEEAIPPPLRSRGVFIVGFPPTRPSPLNTLEL